MLSDVRKETLFVRKFTDYEHVSACHELYWFSTRDYRIGLYDSRFNNRAKEAA